MHPSVTSSSCFLPRTDRLTSAIAEYRLGSDAHLLSRLTKKIFGAYLNKYNVAETKHLKEKMAEHLEMYYKGLSHTKKGPQPVDRWACLLSAFSATIRIIIYHHHD